MPGNPWWLVREDAPDGEAHAFRQVVGDGQYKALCDLVEDPTVLVEPAEGGPRHLACVLALGREAADRQDAVRAEMRKGLRTELGTLAAGP